MSRRLSLCRRAALGLLCRRAALGLAALASVVLANPSPYPPVDYPVTFAAVSELPLAQGGTPHAYGSEPSQFGLLWLPAVPDPAPLVMLIHGGCWLSDYGVNHIQPLASALARAGHAVWAPEYRRVGEAGGGWPGTFDDLRGALAAVAGLGAARIDLSRTVLVGHSAGGHLALWLATRTPPAAAGLRVRGAVGLAAITDLETYLQTGNACAAVAPRLLGGRPGDLPDRYRSASPARAAAATLPLRLLQGTADDIVPESQAQAMPGARVDLLEGAGHYDLIHPGTPAFPALLRAIEDVLTP